MHLGVTLLAADDQPVGERIGPYLFWSLLVVLLLIIVWARAKVRRQAGRRPTVDEYAQQTRAVWEADPATFEPRAEHWPLAVAAPFSIENRNPWDRLDFTELEGPRQGLADAWAIHSRPQLLAQLHDLLREGHRVGFAAEVRAWTDALTPPPRGDDHESDEARWRHEQVRENARDIRTIRFEAWDLVRAAMLTRAGYSLGWLSRAETLDTLYLVAPTLKAAYSSWHDLGHHFFTARWYWFSQGGAAMQDEDNYDAGRFRSLTDTRNGPWAIVPWDLPVPASRLLLVDSLIAEDLVPAPGIHPMTPLAEQIDEAIANRLGDGE